MVPDNRTRFRQWLESGEARLQPLTFPQRELWEASPVPVADAANHICAFIEIKGPITPQECEMAIRRVIERQEALRISFLPGKGRPVQMIRSAGTPDFRFCDLSLTKPGPEAVEDQMQETFRRPFDLVHGPLFRVEMIRRAPDDHVLAFAIHHAVADGWSLGVFVQDLCTAYVMGLKGIRNAPAAGSTGRPDALPAVPLSYSEWGSAERGLWQPAELDRRADFWKSRLAGSRRLCGNPDASLRGVEPLCRWVSAIPSDLASAVRDIARRHRATLFSALLTAFQLTLSKWSGADDVLVGTPVANRSREAVRQTMGYFAGVVPLRTHIERTVSFADQLRSVHETAVDSFANAMPFAELAGTLAEPRSPGEHAVFDVRFALQNHPVPDVVLPRISTKLRMRSTGTARFALGCEITEDGPELEVVWLFQPAIFSHGDISGLNSLFRNMLTTACHGPECRTAVHFV